MIGVSRAWVDRLVETRGLDYVDKEKTKRAARIRVEVRVSFHDYSTFSLIIDGHPTELANRSMVLFLRAQSMRTAIEARST